MLGLLPVRTLRSDAVRLTTVVTVVDPTVIDDADDGYRVGQRWVNTALATTWTLVNATPGAAVWVEEDGGGGGGSDPALGGDLGGTAANGYVKIVRGVSGTYAYNPDGTLNTVTTSLGTMTMVYNGDGSLASIVGTGSYRNKSFGYSSGSLTSKSVA